MANGNFDFMKLLADPNFQQGLGQAGAALGMGESFGEALDPSDLIAQIQEQQANKELLDRILGQVGGPSATTPTTPVTGGTPTPTPLGQAGPDSVTKKVTADGTTTTISEPSEANLNSFGTTTPAESIKGDATNRVSGELPFFQTLLG